MAPSEEFQPTTLTASSRDGHIHFDIAHLVRVKHCKLSRTYPRKIRNFVTQNSLYGFESEVF